MKRLLLAATLLVPIAAHAGGNENGNGCRNRCGDSTGGGTTSSTSSAVSRSIANADAAARANATGGNARAYGGSARATGGTVSPTFNISVPTSSSDPAPTKAALAAPATASATAAPASASVGGYTGEYYGGNTNITTTNNSRVDARSAPAVVVPSIGSGGQCGVVGVGLGGSGLGGGGGFGPSWESTNCRNYYIARELYEMGHAQAAVILFGKITPEAREALEEEAKMQPVAAVAPVVSTPTHAAKPEWCYTASASERAAHKECR